MSNTKSIFSVLTLVSFGGLMYLWKKYFNTNAQLLCRTLIKTIIIKLRKRIFSTLREISFVVNSIHAFQGDLEVRKISQIFMRDGGSGQKRLEMIQEIVMEEEGVSSEDFQYSCDYYAYHDIEIKILLENFRRELDMSLEGVIETFTGPIPNIPPTRILHIQTEIIKRRMQIIKLKYFKEYSDKECLKLEFQIQQYLALQGVAHQTEANQKIFMSLMERWFRDDYGFREELERIQTRFEEFLIEVEGNVKKMKIQEKMQKEKTIQQMQVKVEEEEMKKMFIEKMKVDDKE